MLKSFIYACSQRFFILEFVSKVLFIIWNKINWLWRANIKKYYWSQPKMNSLRVVAPGGSMHWINKLMGTSLIVCVSCIATSVTVFYIFYIVFYSVQSLVEWPRFNRVLNICWWWNTWLFLVPSVRTLNLNVLLMILQSMIMWKRNNALLYVVTSKKKWLITV